MIDQIFKKLRLSYYLVFVLLVLTGVTGYFLAGSISIDNLSDKGIALQSVNILVLLIGIPLGLKIFSVKVKKMPAIEDENKKLSSYLFWSNIRLSLIAVPLLLSTLLYYVCHNNSMLWGAAIAALALLFCKPLKGKMLEELKIEAD